MPLDVDVLKALLQECHERARQDVRAVNGALGQQALMGERECRVAQA